MNCGRSDKLATAVVLANSGSLMGFYRRDPGGENVRPPVPLLQFLSLKRLFCHSGRMTVAL